MNRTCHGLRRHFGLYAQWLEHGNPMANNKQNSSFEKVVNWKLLTLEKGIKCQNLKLIVALESFQLYYLILVDYDTNNFQ